ncbi:MAG: hypothetical protein PHD76_04640 [Methylacidiphilales bacterium]|nr:hypothetical protein [Candidatus Methylacidiphilales bacterium]
MKTVLIVASESPHIEGGGRTLEALRVAAGLAQLSDLQVNLLVKPDAKITLQDASTLACDSQIREYLKLLLSAGGKIFVSESCAPTVYPATRLSKSQIQDLEQSNPIRIEI